MLIRVIRVIRGLAPQKKQSTNYTNHTKKGRSSVDRPFELMNCIDAYRFAAFAVCGRGWFIIFRIFSIEPGLRRSDHAS